MTIDRVYSFVYRGTLAKEAIRTATHTARSKSSLNSASSRLPFELLDERLVQQAREMATVFAAITAFENSVRAFVQKRLLEEVGANWWEICLSEKRRKKAESRKAEEDKIRWHAKRGDSLLEYTEMDDLSSIIITNQDRFLPIVQSIEWARNILKTVEHSRNIIMHSGYIDAEDLERLRLAMRDWLTQIGG